MEDRKTVYVVTAGTDDDYTISAVFLDKEVAEKYAERKNKGVKQQNPTLNYDFYVIEEFEETRLEDFGG